ncbi:MAG: hypothetical protein OEZ02_08750 [Anaerolineae bacterium]|nr:hypothetical protein [Anaerolineae bacterium]
MPSTESQPEQPFWKDEYVGAFDFMLSKSRFRKISRMAFRFLVLFSFFFITIQVRESPPALILMVIFIIFEIIIFAVYWYVYFIFDPSKTSAPKIQALARQNTGATHMGSAVHVAGHPMLARDQPVVLALKHSTLSIHSYESSSPIASLDLGHLDTVHTVVYDDQRVPHLAVIDSAAQALQLTFDLDGRPCTCLFRSMKDLRPIDWYHAIQQTRLEHTNRSPYYR